MANQVHAETPEQSVDIDRLHTLLGWVDAAALELIREAETFRRRLRRCNSEEEFERLADRIEAFARREGRLPACGVPPSGMARPTSLKTPPPQGDF